MRSYKGLEADAALDGLHNCQSALFDRRSRQMSKRHNLSGIDFAAKPARRFLDPEPGCFGGGDARRQALQLIRIKAALGHIKMLTKKIDQPLDGAQLSGTKPPGAAGKSR